MEPEEIESDDEVDKVDKVVNDPKSIPAPKESVHVLLNKVFFAFTMLFEDFIDF